MEYYLIKNGIVVSSQGTKKADVLLEGERIKDVQPSITLEALQENGVDISKVESVDASGSYIFPGFIDAHTHFDLDAGTFRTADDFYSGTKAAIAGGTTTILDFTTQEKGQTLKDALQVWHHMAEGVSSCDYGFHMSITDWNPSVKDEIKDMTRLGVTSYKLYMAYNNLKVNDKEIYEILQAIEEEKGIAGVHCENGKIIEAVVEGLKANNKNSISLHPKSRPAQVEEEAINRLLTIAKLANTPVNVVHLSTRLGLEAVRRARQNGQKVYVETCPQYLTMDDSKYDLPGFDGAAYVLAPPLRKQDDIKALWEGIQNGEIAWVATDHCSFNMKNQKTRGVDDFTNIPNGIPGVEHRPALMYQYGVVDGRMDVETMCRLLSEQPAKVFGMYPHKGAVRPGSDGDLVIWNPDKEWTISAKSMVQNVDYTPFEGTAIKGCPTKVFLRGCLVAENGAVCKEKMGKYVHRGTVQHI